jgi:hypothetical protein
MAADFTLILVEVRLWQYSYMAKRYSALMLVIHELFYSAVRRVSGDANHYLTIRSHREKIKDNVY